MCGSRETGPHQSMSPMAMGATTLVAAAKAPEDFDNSDLADLARLAEVAGTDNSLIEPALGYTGSRTAFDSNGNWLFFVAGD